MTNLSRCEVPFEIVNGWEVEIRPMVLCGWNRIDPSGLFAVAVVEVVVVAEVTAVVGLTIAPVAPVVAGPVVGVGVVVVGGADCELLVVVDDSSDSDILKWKKW